MRHEALGISSIGDRIEKYKMGTKKPNLKPFLLYSKIAQLLSKNMGFAISLFKQFF